MWVWINFLHSKKTKADKYQKIADKENKKLKRIEDEKNNPEKAGMILRAQIFIGGTISGTATIFSVFNDGRLDYLLHYMVAYTLCGVLFMYLLVFATIVGDKVKSISPRDVTNVRTAMHIGVALFMINLALPYGVRCVTLVGLFTVGILIAIDMTHVEGQIGRLPKQATKYLPGFVGSPIIPFVAGFVGFFLRVSLKSAIMGYIIGLYVGLSLGIGVAVGIQILMAQKPVFEGVKWGFIMYCVGFIIHPLYVAFPLFLITLVTVTIKGEWKWFEEEQEKRADRRTGPRQHVVRYKEQLKLERIAAGLDNESSTTDSDHAA
jgi:hypothetical protein